MQGVSVRSLGGARSGEIRLTRFLRNDKVSLQEIIDTAGIRTAQRVTGLHVLAIQDTTSLRDKNDKRSLNAHPTIAVDADSGALLGLVDLQILRRVGGGKKTYKNRSFAEKESHRWLDGAEAAVNLHAAGAAEVTVVADREGDIFEFFAHKPDPVELLVRCSHDRVLSDGAKMSTCLEMTAVAGKTEVNISAAPGRRARTAKLEVRFCPIEIKRPAIPRAADDLPDKIALNMVEVRETEAPEKAKPICWRLLTTHKVKTLEQAVFVTRLYRQRWIIEELFRTLKSRGFDIERVRIAEEPFEKLVAAALVAAVTIMQMVRDRDGTAKRPLEDAFDPEEFPILEAVSRSLEGKTQKQKNPHPKNTLAFATWVCARLGGWTGYYGKPGPVVILRGLYQFRARQRGWNLAKNV